MNKPKTKGDLLVLRPREVKIKLLSETTPPPLGINLPSSGEGEGGGGKKWTPPRLDGWIYSTTYIHTIRYSITFSPNIKAFKMNTEPKFPFRYCRA